MSKSTKLVPVTLSPAELNIQIPPKAAQCFHAAFSGHRTLLEKMLEGTQITVNEHLRKINKDWNLINSKNKHELLRRVFEQVREMLRVDQEDGPPSGTFNSYKTKVSRCLVFPIDMNYAHYNNKGLGQALTKALVDASGGSLRERMKKALKECQEDPKWAGHPPTELAIPFRSTNVDEPIPVQMPLPGMGDSPEHLVYLFLMAFVTGAEQPGLLEILRGSANPLIVKTRSLYEDAKVLMEELKQQAEEQVA